MLRPFAPRHRRRRRHAPRAGPGRSRHHAAPLPGPFDRVDSRGETSRSRSARGARRARMEVLAEPGWAERIRSRFAGGELRLTRKKEFDTAKGVVVKVVLPEFRGLSVGGSGKGTAESGPAPRDVRLGVSGSGDLAWKGTAQGARPRGLRLRETFAPWAPRTGSRPPSPARASSTTRARPDRPACRCRVRATRSSRGRGQPEGRRLRLGRRGCEGLRGEGRHGLHRRVRRRDAGSRAGRSPPRSRVRGTWTGPGRASSAPWRRPARAGSASAEPRPPGSYSAVRMTPVASDQARAMARRVEGEAGLAARPRPR